MIPPLLPVLLWPIVVFVLFKRCSPAVALSVALIGGHLLLPTRVSIDLPLLPAITKDSMPSLAAFIIGALVLRGREAELPPGSVRPGYLPGNKIMLLLFGIAVLGSFVTVLVNGDRLVFGPRVLQGLRPYDGFSLVLGTLTRLLPLLLARKYLARPEDHKSLLMVFCAAGLAYSLPTLMEVRLSPQINVWVYGFFPHDWHQHVRGGGYRPLVFLKHGLWLGIFMAAAVVAAAVCYRMMPEKKGKYLFAVAWLFGTLFLAKTLGAFLITLLILPLVLLLNVRLQLYVAAALAVVVLFYPMLRGGGMVPVDRAVSIAQSIDAQRASSLAFRLHHEDKLLEKANQRPVWGWGSWGRNRVYDENGNDVSVTDGSWVILMGSYGWVGYISRFGLLTIPIMLLAFTRRRQEVTYATAGLCLVLMTNLLDLIPNSSLNSITWLAAGALVGRLELRASDTAPDEEAALVESGPEPRGPRYSRPRSNARPSPTRGTVVTQRSKQYARPRKTDHAI